MGATLWDRKKHHVAILTLTPRKSPGRYPMRYISYGYVKRLMVYTIYIDRGNGNVKATRHYIQFENRRLDVYPCSSLGEDKYDYVLNLDQVEHEDYKAKVAAESKRRREMRRIQ